MRDFIQKTHETFKALQKKVSQLKRTQEGKEEMPELPEPKENKEKSLHLTVSNGTMARFVLIIICLLLIMTFLYQIRAVLVIFFVSLLFAAALDPMVDYLEEKKIPRGIGVILIYFAVLLFLGLFISNLVPVIATEVGELASRIQEWIANLINGQIELPKFLEGLRPSIKRLFEGINISKLGNYREFLMQLANKLSDVAGNVFNAVLVIFNGLFNALLVLVLTFMMTVDEAGIDKFILSLFPTRHASYIREKSAMIKYKIGYWLRGQIVLCVVVGVLVYIGFLIIGLFTSKVEYAATIALLAGFTELIPYAGPFIALFLALPIVANQSLMLIVWTTILMYTVQVLENNIIVPVVMKRAVGISPIFVVFAMMVGFSFLGILGMVLAVPVATTVAIFVKDYAEKTK